MATFDIETGYVRLTVSGENGVIKRKDGSVIRIPSAETKAKLMEEFQKTKDNDKLAKFGKDYPKLIEGDTIATGKKTKVHLEIGYNKGKDKPVDDFRSRVSKTILMGPNSELQLTGFESWDKTDSKTKERHYGESVKTVSLKKGFFHISFSHTEDPLLTPVAEIVIKGGDGGGFFDVCEDITYSCAMKSTSIGAIGMEYKNLRTKKSFLAKSSTFEEIIVTQDAIYRKGLTSMDDLFQYNIQLLLVLQKTISASLPVLDPKEMTNQMKNSGSIMEQGIASLEMMKQMSPEDLERLMKMGGGQITPEIKEQMKELPKMLKMMEEKGMLEQMKKASAMGKGFAEGMGNANIERMATIATKSRDVAKEKVKELTVVNGKDIEELLEQPRKYKPLTKEFGAVKVG